MKDEKTEAAELNEMLVEHERLCFSAADPAREIAPITRCIFDHRKAILARIAEISLTPGYAGALLSYIVVNGPVSDSQLAPLTWLRKRAEEGE